MQPACRCREDLLVSDDGLDVLMVAYTILVLEGVSWHSLFKSEREIQRGRSAYAADAFLGSGDMKIRRWLFEAANPLSERERN